MTERPLIYLDLTRERKPLSKSALDARLSRLREQCLGAPVQAEVTEAAVARVMREKGVANRSLDAMADTLVEKVAEKLLAMNELVTEDTGEDGRFVAPQGANPQGFPFAGVRKTGQTITGDMLRQGIIVLGLKINSFAVLFGVGPARVRRWLKGEEQIPLGVAEYMEMRVARMVRGMAAMTGTPVMVEGDILSDVPDKKQRRALEAMLTGAGH